MALNESLNVNRCNEYLIEVKTGEKHGFFKVDLEFSSNDFELDSFGEVMPKKRFFSLIGYISTKNSSNSKQGTKFFHFV